MNNKNNRNLRMERLENRRMLAVDALTDFSGLAFADLAGERSDAPAAQLAVGPQHVMEVVESRLAFFNKNSGAKLFEQALDDFFAPVGAVQRDIPNEIFVGQSAVAFDEFTERFVVATRELNFADRSSHLLIAVSDDSNPQGQWEKHRINVEEFDKFYFTHTSLGLDADAIYVTGDMYTWDVRFHHVSIVTLEKDALLDGDSDSLTYFDVDFNTPHMKLQPAVMHGSLPGDPMYFVQSSSHNGAQLWVVEMTDKLSAEPTFSKSNVKVPHYRLPPDATQPDGPLLHALDTRILNAAWRDDRLVTVHNVGADEVARARWYELNTAGEKPVLAQVGEINPGPGIHTYFPSVEIAASGDLGMTYIQSSANEFVSMYVIGQGADAETGQLESPVLVKAGEAPLKVIRPNGTEPGSIQSGFQSGIAIDPVDDSFWAANQYATGFLVPEPPRFLANWGTWISKFSLSQSVGMIVTPTAAEIDLLQSGNGDSQLEPGKVDIDNASDASISVVVSHLLATLTEGEQTAEATPHEELLEGRGHGSLDSDALQLLAVNLADLGSS